MNVSNYKKELFPWKKIKILLTSMDEEKNIIFPGILDIVQNEQLEETIKFILSDIGIKLDVNDIEDSHRVGKPDWKTKSEYTIKRLVNRRYRKKKFDKKI